MKIIFQYDAGPQLKSQLANLQGEGLQVVCCPEGEPEPFESELPECEVLWHVLQPVTAEVMDRAPKLKLIQKIGVGVNTIDLEAAQQRGIAVCNMPGTNSRAVMEMTLMLIFAACRRYPMMDNVCRSGQWHMDIAVRESFTELSGKTVGLYGFGAIPRLLAPVLDLLGARVIYHCRTPKLALPYEFVTLQRLVQESDILSLHVGLSKETEKSIGPKEFAQMKRGVIFINTARGGVVDEPALVEALRSGQVGAAGLDVFAEEPAKANNPLFQMGNVVLAPHVAWITQETMTRSIEVAKYNSLAIERGFPLKHQLI